MASKSIPPDVNLNLNVRGLTVSATLAIQELSNSLRQEGRPVFRLGLGQSPFPVPRVVDRGARIQRGRAPTEHNDPPTLSSLTEGEESSCCGREERGECRTGSRDAERS